MGKKKPKMTQADIQYVVDELKAWKEGQRGSRLVWPLIATASGFSRQALSAKQPIAEAFDKAKQALSSGSMPRAPRGEDFHTDKIENLKSEIERYKALEDAWLERFARYAYHCRAKGFSVDELDKPIPVVDRR